MRVRLDGREEITLDTGDAVHFRGDRPHSLRNASAVAAAGVALAVDRRVLPSSRRRLDRAGTTR